MTVESFTPEQTESAIEQLADLLIDAVESGASVGFMPPLAREEALAYWQSVITAMREGHRILLVAMQGGDVQEGGVQEGDVQGAVQMALETRSNGNHRAEAMKLFVHRRARRQGIARALMTEVETTARRIGRTLLVMDTRQGGEAEKLCESLGYVRFGAVPQYARSANGELHTTVFFYRHLV